ncbi:MAG: DNA-processing protein DprA [Melioribacteraceae bacterium]|nr:DNA-processing protein DprA [Melioribacteraceae bacterium]
MILDYKNLAALKLLSSIDGLGPSKILNLISKFQSPSNIFSVSSQSLCGIDRINKILAGRIAGAANDLKKFEDLLEKEFEHLRQKGFSLITYFDKNYPKPLKNIYSPPLFLYISGKIEAEDNYSISMVGTRRATQYGKKVTEQIGEELAGQGITIVSGLARGIDSASHRAALKAGGRTLAVIGSGLDRIYPSENKGLAQQISENGAVISEFPLGTKPDAQNFPRRNRIISGLSLGTVVVESNVNGGAMQTAAHALDQNREVFAIPGNLETPQSEGTNKLIQEGRAKLVKNAEDILVELDLKLKPVIGKNIPKPKVDLNLFEEKLLEVLNSEPIQIDKLSAKVGSTTSDCLVNLLTLEFKGLVKQLPGKQFVKL